jgi:murein DD-endopeptidase MepM/ murein hydrolase activator NlpD
MRRAFVPVLATVVTWLLTGLAGPAGARQDPRWEFYSADTTRYDSPWFAGQHRIMIPFGCTRAPYYDPDSRCLAGRGFHHGIDVAMPCGTGLRAGINGYAVRKGDLGPAYGASPLRLRNYLKGVDIVIGHTRQVYVRPGERIHRGDLIARASDSAAPDGCHLHFEVRDKRGALNTARHPRRLLQLMN